ncbi:HAD-IIA family hydrolase [Terrabacter sp. 2RAF25]|uniref:HAD-IIA family hydrolase n=1 Tax=Terrabacter sp. 2RAF25 TaxID=3232998 RepID=UPI003F9879A0
MTKHTADAALIAAYDGVVCDLDGVVYRGADAVPGAPKALQDLRSRGVKLVYATNNASRVVAEVADHLAGLGAPATPDDVVSSAEAGAAQLARTLPAGSRVLALGGEGVVEALDRAGLAPVRPVRAEEDASDPASPLAAVLQGYGKDLRVRDYETAARLLGAGLPWVATNDDATLPLPWGQSPGNGAYVDLLVAAVGRRPDVVGKPHPPLYRLALDHLGTDPSRTLAVGDRLATDIDGAVAAGIDSVWVLTGVDGPSDLMAADAAPTYLVGSLSELFQPYAAPVHDAGSWRCGAAVARFVDGALEVRADGGSDVEVVRAGAAALLHEREAGRSRDELVRAAAETLDGLVRDAGPR